VGRATAEPILTLILGIAGGTAFAVLGLPLPWLLGALTAIAMAIAGRLPVQVPMPSVHLSHVILALLIGSRFSPDLIVNVERWPLLVAITLALFVFTFGSGWIYFRKLARYDIATATYAAAPGGFVMLMMLAQETGGDTRRIAVVHAMRVLSIFAIVPLLLMAMVEPSAQPAAETGVHSEAQHALDWLLLAGLGGAGLIAGRLLRLPGRTVLGPLILSAIAHATGFIEVHPPMALLAAVQVFIGISVGLRFVGLRLDMLIRDMILGICWSLVILAIAIGTAFLMAPSIGLETAQLILVLTPGGLPETSVMALALGLDVAMVVICNMARFIAVVISVPLITSRIRKRPRRESSIT